MNKKMRKVLSVLTVLPLLYVCEPATASAQNYQALTSGSGRGATIGTLNGYNGEYRDGYVGQIIQAKGKVLYQADNAKDAKALAVEENTKPVEEYLTNIIQQLVRLPIL